MRIPAALLALSLLAVLAPPAAAQGGCMEDADYQVRAGFGDVRCTGLVEGDGFHVVQSLAVGHTQGNDTAAELRVPAGMQVPSGGCTGPSASCTVTGGVARYTIEAGTATGSYRVTLTATVPTSQAVAVELQAPAGAESALHVFVPDGKRLLAAGDPVDRACPGGVCVFEDIPAWFTVQPDTLAAVVPPETGASPWLMAGLGFLVGAVIWAMLVQRGAVQKRRPQEVAVAAHKEAAAKENSTILETRKRALMAALKEVEVARMQNEIDVATYETVKADLKRQTVTVLRAIEEAHAREAASPATS